MEPGRQLREIVRIKPHKQLFGKVKIRQKDGNDPSWTAGSSLFGGRQRRLGSNNSKQSVHEFESEKTAKINHWPVYATSECMLVSQQMH